MECKNSVNFESEVLRDTLFQQGGCEDENDSDEIRTKCPRTDCTVRFIRSRKGRSIAIRFEGDKCQETGEKPQQLS